MRASVSTVSCVGAVLAGGASSRYGGRAKGLLHVGGRRIVDRVIDALREATSSQFIVAKNRAAIEAEVPGIRVVVDVSDERTSLVGLHTALTFARGAVLVVAWDMPFVSGGLLRALRAAGERDGAAAVPEGPHGLEPLCAYYPPAALELAAHRVARCEYRLTDFIESLPQLSVLPMREVALFGDPRHIFANVNDPGDLVAAEHLLAEGERSASVRQSSDPSLREHR